MRTYYIPRAFKFYLQLPQGDSCPPEVKEQTAERLSWLYRWRNCRTTVEFWLYSLKWSGKQEWLKDASPDRVLLLFFPSWSATITPACAFQSCCLRVSDARVPHILPAPAWLKHKASSLTAEGQQPAEALLYPNTDSILAAVPAHWLAAMVQSSRRCCGCSQVPRGQWQLLFFFFRGVFKISTVLPVLGAWAENSQPWPHNLGWNNDSAAKWNRSDKNNTAAFKARPRRYIYLNMLPNSGLAWKWWCF